MNLEEKLKEKFANALEKRDNIIIVEEKDKNQDIFINIYKNQDLSYIDYLDLSQNDIAFLKDKTMQLLILNNSNKIALGKIFSEVFEKIGKQKNGCWKQWINQTKINERTALRYRNRYELFTLTNSDYAKKVILELGQDEIDKIISDDNTANKILDLIEKGADKNTIKEYLNQLLLESNVVNEKEKIEETFDKITIERVSDFFQNNIIEKWNDIEKPKKKKIYKLINKIKEIINN